MDRGKGTRKAERKEIAEPCRSSKTYSKAPKQKSSEKVKQSGDKSDYLYHYTTPQGKEGIKDTKMIKQSPEKSSKNKDALFGPGVYLTKTSPDQGKTKIFKNNYDDTPDGLSHDQKERVSHYVKVQEKDLPGVMKCETKRDVYRYPSDINLEDKRFSTGEVRGAMMPADKTHDHDSSKIQ